MFDGNRGQGKGWLGGVAVALSNERQSTAAWERGAIGGEFLGVRLDGLVGGNLAVLHDQRSPGSTVVGGRDSSKLIDGELKQLEVVRGILGDGIPITGALSFVEADWPLVGGAFRTRDAHLLWPKRLAKLLVEGGSGGVDVNRVCDELAQRLRLDRLTAAVRAD